MAFDVHQVLMTCKTVVPPTAAPAAAIPTKAVHLAEATSGLRPERDRIRRELQERGFVVVPAGPLPLMLDGLRHQVEEQLAQVHALCTWSATVHLVGFFWDLVGDRHLLFRRGWSVPGQLWPFTPRRGWRLRIACHKLGNTSYALNLTGSHRTTVWV